MIHRAPDVLVYHQLVFPLLNLNWNVVLDDGERKVCANPPPFLRRRLLTTLKAAGFRVEIRRTWIFSGISYTEQIS